MPILPRRIQILPKPFQNRSKRLLGAHLGPLFQKDMIWNAQQAVKMRPKMAPRRSRASQTLPKWSPRLSQIRFLNDFCACFFLVVNLHHFICSFVAEFVCFCKSRPLKFMRPRSALLTSIRFGMFRKKYQKSSKNLPETCSKSRKKQKQIEKNENKSMEKAKMSEKCVTSSKK